MRPPRKKLAALELIRTLERGPAFSFDVFGFRAAPELTKAQRAEIQAQVNENLRLWLDTWILPPVRSLIPELNTKVVKNSVDT